jgi:hypothetical protein
MKSKKKYSLYSTYPKTDTPVICHTHKFETHNMLDWFVHMLRAEHVLSGQFRCGNCYAYTSFDFAPANIQPEKRLLPCKQCQTKNKLDFPALPPLSYLYELVDDKKITWEEFHILEDEAKARLVETEE